MLYISLAQPTDVSLQLMSERGMDGDGEDKGSGNGVGKGDGGVYDNISDSGGGGGDYAAAMQL